MVLVYPKVAHNYPVYNRLMLARKWGKGFTLIEVLVIVAVIGVLSAIIFAVAVPQYRQRTYLTRATSELHTLANALTLYASKYNDYPPDVERNIPSDIMEFLQTNGQNDVWPNAPWPGSVYDYDRWDDLGVIQMSIRFCAAGDETACDKNFPKQSFVSEAWDSESAVYFCIKGPCRASQSQPVSHPGYCLNCGTTPSKFF